MGNTSGRSLAPLTNSSGNPADYSVRATIEAQNAGEDKRRAAFGSAKPQSESKHAKLASPKTVSSPIFEFNSPKPVINTPGNRRRRNAKPGTGGTLVLSPSTCGDCPLYHLCMFAELSATLKAVDDIEAALEAAVRACGPK